MHAAELLPSPSRSGRAFGRWSVLLGVVLLLGAIALVIYGEHRPVQRQFHVRIADLLPAASELPGWSVQDLPIADTPEMRKKVGETLNYDDALFRVYQRGGDRLSVYVAYWAPGKMSPRLIASHTPDVCWVGGGWKVEKAESGIALGVGRWEIGDGDGTRERGAHLLPAEERTMSKDGTTEYVVFWHRVGREALSYRTQGKPPWYAVFVEMGRYGFRQRQEQFFIRISSNRAVDTWPQFDVYRLLIERLPVKRG